MLKALTVVFLVSTCFAQSSADGVFVVRSAKKSGTMLPPAQMRQAEKLYQSACAAVQQDFRSSNELHPHFTVLVGKERNEIHNPTELWLKKWNPELFTQAVVVLAFDQMLTVDLRKQLTRRAVQYASASVDVAEFKQEH